MSNSAATDTENASLGGASVLKWDEEWSIQGASKVHALLLESLNEAKSISIDIGDAERVDTAVLQLLAAARADAMSRGIEWEWKGSSAVFEKAVEQLGLDVPLGVGRK